MARSMWIRTWILLIVSMCSVRLFAADNEWYATTGIVGQDSDWYNPLNWSAGHIPAAGELIEWRYASNTAVYNPIIINGGTAESGTSSCGIWYANTASFTVTNGATYTINGNLNLYNGASDAAHSPADVEFIVEDGSTVNVTVGAQIGRKLVVGDAFGQATLTVDGTGTVYNQTGSMSLGWGDDRTETVRLNVINGAVMNFLTTGGLVIADDPDIEDDVIVNVAGGTIKIRGDRRSQVFGWIADGYLVAYDGTGDIGYSYDGTDTIITSNASLPTSNEWYGNAYTGEDMDWFNPRNWTEGMVPTSSQAVTWRYASSNGSYQPIVIDGGTAESANSTCAIWYSGTAGMTITNGATYNITGNLNLQNGADANPSHHPANIDFVLDGGSVLNVSAETQVGRKFVTADAVGQVDILIDGAGTQWNQGSVMWLGWATSGENRTEPINMTISNGAELNINMAGGLQINSLVTDEVLIDVAGGTLNLAGDRRGQVSTMISNGHLVAYNGDGLLTTTYDSGTATTIVASASPPPVIPETAKVTGFWDDFDSYLPGTMFCGDPIILATPPTGQEWNNLGTDIFGTVLECTTGNPGYSMSLLRSAQGSPVVIQAYEKPKMFNSEGFTYRFEHDVYVPSDAGNDAEFFVACGSTKLGYRAFGNFYIVDGVNPGINTGIAVPLDQWVHIRIDIYDNNSCYMWYTPEGGEETLFAADVNWPASLGYPVRSEFFGVSWTTPTVYYDNVHAQMIDNMPMGYPQVSATAQTVTIDGSIDTNVEWSDATIVANKPLNAKGNFNPVMAAGYYLGLDDTTTVDIYMTYDDDYFYVAIDGNNMTHDQATLGDNGRVETVFTWDYDGVQDTVSYVYRFWPTTATGARSVWKSVAYEAETSLDYADFTAAGGAMAYTAVAGDIQAEFKIPVAFMSELAGLGGCQTLNVQFNYVEQPTGDHRGTTNVIGAFIPDLIYGTGQRFAPLMSGISLGGDIEGDITGDCAVDSDDLAAMIATWTTDDESADINSDGVVDLRDYALMVVNWLVGTGN